MKKKIILIIVILILAFFVGMTIHHIVNYFENKKIDEKYLKITGVIDDIYLDKIYVIPDDESVKIAYDKVSFTIPTTIERDWCIGDMIEIKYFPGQISENGTIDSPILEYLGKSRLFKNKIDAPVSNSEYPAGTPVFKPFNIYNEKFSFKEFKLQDQLYFKKIISYTDYLEYKKNIPELRDLTENDFINYYLVILVGQDSEYSYTFEKLNINENTLDLRILKNKPLSQPETMPSHSGLAIIIPNNTDYPDNKINIVDANLDY